MGLLSTGLGHPLDIPVEALLGNTIESDVWMGLPQPNHSAGTPVPISGGSHIFRTLHRV